MEQGKYVPGFGAEPVKYPGHESHFTNSDAYKLKFRGAPPKQQMFDEFRPVKRAV